MGIGDVFEVETVRDCYYVDTGMYDAAEYGAVYIIDAERPALIDAGIGTDTERILAALEAVGIEPRDLEVIVATHVHLDHAGGAGVLVEKTDATVYVHESGARFLADPTRLWEGTKSAVGSQIQFYAEPKPVPTSRIEPIHDGSRIDLGDRSLDVHHAPGHAFHQVVLYDRECDAVYAADAAGIYIPQLDSIRAVSPPPGFDLEGVLGDVRMLAGLGPGTICYAHFGPTAAEDKLAAYVEATTEWVEAVVQKRAELSNDDEVIEHFVEATDLGDLWGAEKAEGQTAMNVRGVFHYLDTRRDT